jgi:hypothetical protein
LAAFDGDFDAAHVAGVYNEKEFEKPHQNGACGPSAQPV